jgi:hypothetical protein
MLDGGDAGAQERRPLLSRPAGDPNILYVGSQAQEAAQAGERFQANPFAGAPWDKRAGYSSINIDRWIGMRGSLDRLIPRAGVNPEMYSM